MVNKSLKLAIEKFNNGEFFDCHDILEDTWFEVRQNEKNFYQGLLHYAVAFHHLINKKNPPGAKLQFRKCMNRLKSYDKIYNGIDIKKILQSSNDCLRLLEKGNPENIKVPKIKLKM